jgi:hypothetical protein
MLINMIHDNHGEPPFKTRYREPAALRAMGYEAVVIPDALAAIPGAFVDPGNETVARAASVTPRKPQELADAIDAQVAAAAAAGMAVYFYGDALLLPLTVVDKRPGDFLCEDGSGRLCPGKPAVYAALQDQVDELFDRWPAAAGLVMRTGEVYPEATPHLTGSPLHAGNCPVCRELPLVDRQVRFITAMHDVVAGRLGRTYVHRAWQPAVAGLPNMHDDPAVYREVSGRVPASPRLWFSFKFTRGDFRRGQTFNPCLLADERPKWVEFQCEREYEGKGAFPNYQAGIWKEFFSRLCAGLGGGEAGAAGDGGLRGRFGVWGWSRGGGWGGPYVQREEWIDVNVRALARLWADPAVDVGDVATAWVGETFGVAESAPPTPAIAELLAVSTGTIRRLLYVAALDGERGRADLPWVKDDLLDVDAIYAAAGRTVELGAAAAAAAIAEKREALANVDRIRQLFDIAAPDLPNKSQVRDLSNALAYFHSFAGTVAHLYMGFVRCVAWVQGGRADVGLAAIAAEHLQAAQTHWQLHTQRHALLPGAPSVFHEQSFWERTNGCLGELEGERGAGYGVSP